VKRAARAAVWCAAVSMLTAACGATAESDPPSAGSTVTLPFAGGVAAADNIADAAADNIAARIVDVVDGDTIKVELDGVVERVRLIGIDTPERGECLADVAADRVAELIGTGAVELSLDVSDRDQYGRLLRAVIVGDGTILNVRLVQEGLAIARSYPPDTSLDDVLAAAEATAVAEKKGLWSGNACGSPSDAQIGVYEFNYDPDGDDTLVLTEEWVSFRNTGDAAVDLTGWSVRDESASKRYEFPAGFSLDGGAVVVLRSGCGVDTETDLYWCISGSAIWNNSGDTAFLLDPSGNIHDSMGY